MTLRNYIPNTITSMNLLCGAVGVVFAFRARFDLAFAFMIAGAVCDFLDGFAARLLGAYSDIGKELDSLADLVTFGLLPAGMLFSLSSELAAAEVWYCWIPLAIVVFSALRLAKFNVDDSQGTYFAGLPTPANALFCASLCCLVHSGECSFLCRWAAGPVFIPLLSLVMCVLLVCPMRMFSFKFHKDDAASLKLKRTVMLVLAVVAVLVCVLAGLHWSFAVFATMSIYILLNVVYSIFGI